METEKVDRQAEVRLQQTLSRSFWEGWDPGLLKTWLQEFKVSPSIWQEEDREKMIDHLVRYRARYPQPAAGVEQEELTKCWHRMNPEDKLSTVPGVYKPSPAKASRETPPPSPNQSEGEEEEEKEGGPPAPVASALQPVQLAPRFDRRSNPPKVPPEEEAETAQRLKDQAVDLEVNRLLTIRMNEIEAARLADPISVSALQERRELEAFRAQRFQAAAPAAAPRPAQQSIPPMATAESEDEECRPAAQCQVCAKVAPAHLDTRGPWNCPYCNLRGDAAGAAGNAMTLMMRNGQAPSTPAAAATGQSDTTLRGLDKHFDSLIKQFRTSEKFAAPGPHSPAEAEALVKTAFAEGHLALDTSMYDPPKAMLIKLIQQGKLQQIGFALPVPIATSIQQSEDSIGSFEVTGGKFTARLIGDAAAPPIESPAQFARALVATIIPALIAQPAAIMQWCAFARTVFELEKAKGWALARSYIERTLTNRVATASDMASVDIPTVMSITLAAGNINNQQHHQHRPPPNSGGGQGPLPRASACRKFNSSHGCDRPACPHAHIRACWNCFDPSHQARECPNPKAQVGAARGGRGGSGGGRGGRGGGRGGAAASTVGGTGASDPKSGTPSVASSPKA